MNIFDLQKMKQSQQKISMVTCYDFWSAQILAESAIPLILVGDSAANVIHGFSSTLNMDTHLMALHVAAVARGVSNKFIIGDLPFLSYRKDLTYNMTQVEKIMKAGAHAVKLEGAEGNLSLIQHCVESGVPVMGHLGLTPQSLHQLGGMRVQGRNQEQARKIFAHAQALEQAGCFALVLECVPSPLAAQITQELKIPTIGIGAGPDTDGQVLVMQDLLGLNGDFKPKFLRKFLDGKKLFLEAFNDYHKAVSEKSFPAIEESYE
ncbi:MAG: 3-methyl-2-oxobutanoate hydroxymethyltransferase [Bdellovibrionales bacterium]|nr:3-methyl-2-oxobutanoate hydroxymethyltransferase [Bdellovibrionales bacterium]